ncbi:acyl-CoA thioesterase [Pseudomonas sp. CrR25]|nr:acyl-CoA thioesterase [Pseudomonas sp. CrR25]
MSPFFEASIKPRFSETDMRGHISNTVVPVWLADGRAALFREKLGSQIPTMIVNLNVDFRRELHWGSMVTVRTAVERIGNSSIIFIQELWQNDQACVQARTTVIAVDIETRKSMRVPDEERTLLAPYLVSAQHAS